jgi:tetratricopeptide (TPR) repeat protein
LLFLALGAAASGPDPLRIGVPRALRTALVIVAAVVGGVIAVGCGYVLTSPRASSAAYADARVARRLLPMWAVSYLRTARIDAAHSRFKGAEHWLTVATQREPYEAILWTQRASVEEQNGALVDAEAHYRRALEDDKYSVIALNRLVELLVRTGRPQEARVYLRRSLQVTPNQPEMRKLLQ